MTPSNPNHASSRSIRRHHSPRKMTRRPVFQERSSAVVMRNLSANCYPMIDQSAGVPRRTALTTHLPSNASRYFGGGPNPGRIALRFSRVSTSPARRSAGLPVAAILRISGKSTLSNGATLNAATSSDCRNSTALSSNALLNATRPRSVARRYQIRSDARQRCGEPHTHRLSERLAQRFRPQFSGSGAHCWRPPTP